MEMALQDVCCWKGATLSLTLMLSSLQQQPPTASETCSFKIESLFYQFKQQDHFHIWSDILQYPVMMIQAGLTLSSDAIDWWRLGLSLVGKCRHSTIFKIIYWGHIRGVWSPGLDEGSRGKVELRRRITGFIRYERKWRTPIKRGSFHWDTETIRADSSR